MARLTVKARAVDMLGRQQIAGVPTAIHELFKNAHDAYADHVVVDYFRSDALFVLRDDGMGMTEEEFLQRWLTVGTDSKVEDGTLVRLVPPEGGQRIRPVLGEKGIGRLAIATIGPLVLVLTRSRRQTAGNGVTAALVHWGFFAIPGLDIDRIDIPVVSLDRDEKPDGTLVDLLKAQVTANASALVGQAPERLLAAIRADVGAFELDLPALHGEIGGPLIDEHGQQGTHFYILPADRIIENDIDDSGEYVASPLTKALLGFSNTMVPGASAPPLVASFRDHRLDGTSSELVAERSFFTPEEFESADHHFAGEFDRFGQFTGEVAVFGSPPRPYRTSWPNPNGRPTECGPFRLNFAYVQGAARESRLDPDEYARMAEKLNRIGGLYLYRDGVRILPYGNSDYDFLDIESVGPRVPPTTSSLIAGCSARSRPPAPPTQVSSRRPGGRVSRRTVPIGSLSRCLRTCSSSWPPTSSAKTARRRRHTCASGPRWTARKKSAVDGRGKPEPGALLSRARSKPSSSKSGGGCPSRRRNGSVAPRQHG